MQGYFSSIYAQLTTTQLFIAVAVLVLLIVVAVAAYVQYRRTRTRSLRNRFGTEYDRAVLSSGTRDAESKLSDRKTRVETLEIRDLGVAERERFINEWHTVQSRFVDHPRSSVTEADELINALLEARKYPQVSFEQRAADLSVSYPRVMENYRAAHAIAVPIGQVEITTEQLRAAMIQYRAIFDELAQPLKLQDQKTAA
ncbi:MAG: hypothetical protein ACLQLH_09050 [Terracidiphilus sp.]